MYTFEAELWLYEGEAGWCFVTVSGAISDAIRARTTGRRRGFGSVRVRATTGGTTWTTSVFPDTKREAYLLPVKKEVRNKESLTAGDRVRIALDLLDT